MSKARASAREDHKPQGVTMERVPAAAAGGLIGHHPVTRCKKIDPAHSWIYTKVTAW